MQHYLSLWNIKIIVIVVRHNERAPVFFFFFFTDSFICTSTPTLVLLLVNCPIIKMRSKLQNEEEFLAYNIFFVKNEPHSSLINYQSTISMQFRAYVQNFYLLKIHLNLFEISNRVLKFENLIQI